MNVRAQHRRHHLKRAADADAELLVRDGHRLPNPIPPLPIPSLTLPGVLPTAPTTTSSLTITKPTIVVTTSSSSSSSPSTTSTPYIVPNITKPSHSIGQSTQHASHTSAIASVHPTNTAPASSGAATRAVVGGVFAAIICLGIIMCSTIFLVGRYRKRREQDSFDRGSFRRSAVVLPEPPTHEDTVERGFNPRPPSMIERKLANTPSVTHASQQQYNGYQTHEQSLEPGHQYQFGTEPQYDYANAQSFLSFSPGQVMANASPARTPNPVEPLLPPTVFGGSPTSPVASPISSNGMSSDPSLAYSSNGDFLNKQSPTAVTLTRQPSNGGALDSEDAHYVDLNRSSISPFQARQYAEISKTLNADMPLPLPELPKMYRKQSSDLKQSLDEPFEPVPPYKERASTTISGDKKTSPFADPVVMNNTEEQDLGSVDSHENPALLRARVNSTPPVLPELGVYQRTFSPTPFSSTFDSMLSPASHVPTALQPGNHKTTTTASETPKARSNRPDTMCTLDDPDDAYGGI